MNRPEKTKTVTLAVSFEVDADLPEDDVHSIISDALVQIDEGVLRDDADPFAEWEVWTDRGETTITIDGVEA